MADILQRQQTQVQPAQLERVRRKKLQQARQTRQEETAKGKYLITGKDEYIERSQLKGLQLGEVRTLKSKGLDQFLSEYQARINAESVLLSTGERVDREKYEQLPRVEQLRLNRLGIEGYIQKTTVKLATDEYVDKSTFASLPSKYRKILREQGIEKYNEYIEKEIKPLLKKRQEAQRELVYYKKLDRDLAIRGYARAYKPKIVPLYDSEGNIVNYHVRKGYFSQPESWVWVKTGESTWYAKGKEVKDDEGNITDVIWDYKSKIPVEKYNSLRPELQERYVKVTVDEVDTMLKDQAGALFELNRDLPEGYEVTPTGTQHIKGASLQNVMVTTPEGEKFGGTLSSIYKQFKDEGKVTGKKYVYPPAPTSLQELGVKFRYINPYTMKVEKRGILGTNTVRFKYDGKEVIMNELDAPKMLTIANKVKSDPDSKYNIIVDNTMMRVVDKDTGQRAFKNLTDAYNQIMTDGKYNPYVSPFTGMVQLPGLISIYTGLPSSLGGAWGNTKAVAASGFTGVRYLVSTPTGLRNATSDEIKKAQQITREALALQEYMKPPTAAELIGAKRITTLKSIKKSDRVYFTMPPLEFIRKYNVSISKDGKYYVTMKDGTSVTLEYFNNIPKNLQDKAYNSGISSIYKD